MRQGTYLNVILTVNAVLLAGVLWTALAGHPVLDRSASAQSSGTTGSPSLIPVTAADQRESLLNAVRDVKASVDGLKKSLEGGKVRVEIANVDQLRGAMEKK